ncbi:MAG: hypothetical protein H0X25_05855 [Acidobacteriales bacterium]|nr:hypothetical protein [Terriglobales bacterium]
MKPQSHLLAAAAIFCLITLSCGGGGASGGGSNRGNPPPAQSGNYVIATWSELGMHCTDGKDYSIFSVLPPYNTVRAQVLKRGNPPTLVTGGITLTYEATADSTGSINTVSSNKTNFWDHARALFLNGAAPDVGLTGNKVQSATPQPLVYDASLQVWEAVGIPTVPYDDKGNRQAYPMAKIVARDASGAQVADSTVVLAVSDELTCSNCHASGSDAAAKPAAGWENNPDSGKDTKLNILRKHDERWNISGYLSALQSSGYTYQASLYETAMSGTPVLCAACHSTNALGAAGIAGINPVTQDMHTLHGPLINPSTGTSLDQATTPEQSCYLCHPGVQTKCQRGAMHTVACFDCHGNLTKVGAPTREGWLDLPACQMCHSNSVRYLSTFDPATGNWRVSNDSVFATTPNKPVAGKSLYRFSSGHGTMYCTSCHGSTHAEYPTVQPNDNVYSTALQGYAGKLTECGICHTVVPTTADGGAHGLHNIGQDWVNNHHTYASGGGYTQCAYCHGSSYQGTVLSRTSQQRTFSVEEGGQKIFANGQAVSCYDCHDGPNGG